MPDGTPAKGVGVIAWDSDTAIVGGKDDFMCRTHTDSSGNYKMTYYKSSPWDTKVPGSTSFRPDIYLTIHALAVGTLPVKRTGVNNNWRMSNNLKIDVTLPGIMGRITINGLPANGVVVKAFDSDGFLAGKDDPICQTRTGGDGRYMALYGGKHYDSTPPSPGIIAGLVVGSVVGFPGIDILTQYVVQHVVNKGWDYEMHRRFTSWRPDIYLKIYTNPVRKSKIYPDWPHRKTLIYNLNLTQSAKPQATGKRRIIVPPGTKAK